MSYIRILIIIIIIGFKVEFANPRLYYYIRVLTYIQYTSIHMTVHNNNNNIERVWARYHWQLLFIYGS